MTIAEIKEAVSKTKEMKAMAQAEMLELKTQAAEKQRQRAEAVAAGDVETYTALQHEPEETLVKINALKAAIFKPLLSRKEILETWNPYIKAKNKTFSRKVEAYKKARADLCAQFMEIVEMQRETLEEHKAVLWLLQDQAEYRRRLGDKESYERGVEAPALLERPSSLNTVQYNGMATYPDAAFFVAGGELKEDQRGAISIVLLSRTPVSAESLQGDNFIDHPWNYAPGKGQDARLSDYLQKK